MVRIHLPAAGSENAAGQNLEAGADHDGVLQRIHSPAFYTPFIFYKEK